MNLPALLLPEKYELDTGAKVVHTGKRTSSYINTKSISRTAVSAFRSSVQIGKQASGSKASVSCQSLMLDDISRSDTVPAMISGPAMRTSAMRQDWTDRDEAVSI